MYKPVCISLGNSNGGPPPCVESPLSKMNKYLMSNLLD